MSRGRVLVASDRIGPLNSAEAGAAIAAGFAGSAEVAVLPLAAGGPDLVDALAALTGGTVRRDGRGWSLATPDRVVIGFEQPSRPDWAPDATTGDLGEWVRRVLERDQHDDVVLDLTGVTAHDAGAGLIAAGPALAGRRLVGLVPEDELDLTAIGATGMLARRAHRAGVDLAELLAAEAALRSRTDELAPGVGVRPGSGAAGGTGLAILAEGGLLVSPTQFCYQLADAARVVRAADLVVTGCTELAAIDRGGEVVAAVTRWAEDAERPCIAFSSGTGLARRELRTFGLEAAHRIPVPIDADGLAAVAARIAAGWFPGRG